MGRRRPGGARGGSRGGARGRRPAAVARVRHQRRARLLPRLGCRCARRRRGRRRRSVRESTARTRAHGDQRDRGRARGIRVDGVGQHAGALRRAERPRRPVRGRTRLGTGGCTRCRGWVRCEAPHLPGVSGRREGRGAARSSRPLAGDAEREPAEHESRARPGATGRGRRTARRDAGRHARRDRRRHGRLPRRRFPAGDHRRDEPGRVPVAGGCLSRVGRRHEHDTGDGLPWRGPARSNGDGRAGDGSGRRRARARSRRGTAPQLRRARGVPVHHSHGHDLRHRGLYEAARRGVAPGRLRGSARRAARAPRAFGPCAARDRRGDLRRDHRLPVPRPRDGAGRGERIGDGPNRHLASWPGARDLTRSAGRRGAQRPDGAGPCHPLRHG